MGFLVRSSSITNRFIFIQNQCQQCCKVELKKSGLASHTFRVAVVYLDNSSFQLKLNGLFQMAGQFMKAETE